SYSCRSASIASRTVDSSSASSARANSSTPSGASLAKKSASMIRFGSIPTRPIAPVQPEVRERLALTNRDFLPFRELEARHERDNGVQPIPERRDQPRELDPGQPVEGAEDQIDLLLDRDLARRDPMLRGRPVPVRQREDRGPHHVPRQRQLGL